MSISINLLYLTSQYSVICRPSIVAHCHSALNLWADTGQLSSAKALLLFGFPLCVCVALQVLGRWRSSVPLGAPGQSPSGSPLRPGCLSLLLLSSGTFSLGFCCDTLTFLDPILWPTGMKLTIAFQPQCNQHHQNLPGPYCTKVRHCVLAVNSSGLQRLFSRLAAWSYSKHFLM